MAGVPKKAKLTGCGWNSDDPQYIAYHDEEWGRPQKDSRLLFEMLCLGGQQAGLSWNTIFKKRERYNQVFYNFDPEKISKMDSSKINELMNDASIIRNRGKIESVIHNAKCYLNMEKSGENFSSFIWSFVDNEPIVNSWHVLGEAPTQSEQSVAMSKALKKRKFKFVGPTICYAFMQTCGLVNDHVVECFRHPGHNKINRIILKHSDIMTAPKKPKLARCSWLTDDPQYMRYHDEEWGRPQRDSRLLFQMLCLEGQQAGLSWITVLKKRDRYNQLFHNFKPDTISEIDRSEISKLMNDAGIIRHRGKIEAIVDNAKSYIAMENSGENFSQFIWSFVNNEPIVNNWKVLSEVPTHTERSVAMAKELKKRKFKFVGPTICYAFMQACGLVNDHTVDCFCHPRHSKIK